VAGDIRVWRIDLSQATAGVEGAAAALLAADERERAEQGIPEVRRRRLVGRAALRVALSRWLDRPPASLRFVSDPNGKPALADTASGEVHFNMATSGDCCLIALTAEAPIGVDVERIAPVPELEQVVVNRFAPAEASAIVPLSGEPRLRAFYNCWTRKEAYLKASGIGLTRELGHVAVSVDDDRPAILSLADDDPGAWSLAAIDAGPGLVGAVALRGTADWRGKTIEADDLPLDFGSG
jgi:4'-phosphopantetheinyl transferase